MYYGDELGLRDVPIPPEQALDPQGRRLGRFGLGRDPERSPMPWDDSPGAGFTTGTPWLPLTSEFRETNFERQRRDPASLIYLYRRLLALRRQERALVDGDYAPVESPDGTVAFTRTADAGTLLVALNIEAEPRSWELPAGLGPGRVLLSTRLDREGSIGRHLELRDNEGVIIASGRP
jgi:alpha-glucosidase